MKIMENEKNRNQYPEIIAEVIESGKRDLRRTWCKPVVTRIEMKRTMLSVGSGNDGTTPATI